MIINWILNYIFKFATAFWKILLFFNKNWENKILNIKLFVNNISPAGAPLLLEHVLMGKFENLSSGKN